MNIPNEIQRTGASSTIKANTFAKAGITHYPSMGLLALLCWGAKFGVEESRGPPLMWSPLCTNKSPKLPLAMQIQSVSADCLKKRKKLEVLTTIQFSLHLFFALLSLSPPPSVTLYCSSWTLWVSPCMSALTVAWFNRRHCPGSLSNFSPCHSHTMPLYQQLCYGCSTVQALQCQHRLRPCYRN